MVRIVSIPGWSRDIFSYEQLSGICQSVQFSCPDDPVRPASAVPRKRKRSKLRQRKSVKRQPVKVVEGGVELL